MKYCFDTSICVEMLRHGTPSIKTQMRSRSPEAIKIPAIVRAELLLGVLKCADPLKAEGVVEAFLAPFETVPFDTLAAEWYARIRHNLEQAGTPVGPNDLIVASTALAVGAVLVTANIKEFSRIKELTVESWR